jgi:hypothetical protein
MRKGFDDEKKPLRSTMRLWGGIVLTITLVLFSIASYSIQPKEDKLTKMRILNDNYYLVDDHTMMPVRWSLAADLSDILFVFERGDGVWIRSNRRATSADILANIQHRNWHYSNNTPKNCNYSEVDDTGTDQLQNFFGIINIRSPSGDVINSFSLFRRNNPAILMGDIRSELYDSSFYGPLSVPLHSINDVFTLSDCSIYALLPEGAIRLDSNGNFSTSINLDLKAVSSSFLSDLERRFESENTHLRSITARHLQAKLNYYSTAIFGGK